jgi:hypothetical protein
VIFVIFFRLCGFCGFLARHEGLPIVLDIFFTVIHISLWWLKGKMRTKMLTQPAQLKMNFLSCAMKSCMADGGRPSGDGLQEQSPNRPELHMLRAFVVSVREKGLPKRRSGTGKGDERK